jgi:hypothetical protein
MHQTRLMSMLEAATNVVAGYGLAVGLQLVLFPVFGLHPTLGQSLKIGVWFTLLSLLRSYALRRLFDRLARRS